MDELAFFNAYGEAWGLATTNGFDGLWAIGSGEGLTEFNTLVAEQELSDACSATLETCFAGAVFDLWPCFLEFVYAKIYCYTEGESG